MNFLSFSSRVSCSDYKICFSGAIAGNPFGVDREQLAKDLNFDHASYNSIDSVQSRDFICKFVQI